MNFQTKNHQKSKKSTGYESPQPSDPEMIRKAELIKQQIDSYFASGEHEDVVGVIESKINKEAHEVKRNETLKAEQRDNLLTKLKQAGLSET